MKVDYDIVGSGEPLLLVAGLGQTRRRWHRVVPLLADDFTVVSFDNRETGGTGPCVDGFGLDDIANDALDLMRDIGFDEFFLIGHSMGGMISQEIIRIAGAERVRAALLLSTHGGASINVPPPDMGVLMPAPGDDRPVWAKLAGPGFWEANPDVIDAETQLSIEQATAPEGYMRQMQAIMAFDPPEGAVRDTGVPIVVAHGDADPLVPYENGVRLAKRLGCELVTWEGAGHVVDCEVPHEIAALARRHFRAA